MRVNLSIVLVSLVTALQILPAQAEPMVKPQDLMDKNCVRCHGSEVYTRADRRVKTLEGLHQQVRRCTQMVGTAWFDEEIDAVAKHLNQLYYRFQ
ncbi:Green heme protein [Gammaproteobacteria bacterium]